MPRMGLHFKNSKSQIHLNWIQEICSLSHRKTHGPYSKNQMFYVFFWVYPRRLIVVCWRFGTLYLFHIHRLDMKYYFVLHIQPMKMEQIECSETSAYKNQTSGKYPKEYIQDSKHGESLKSRKTKWFMMLIEVVACAENRAKNRNVLRAKMRRWCI